MEPNEALDLVGRLGIDATDHELADAAGLVLSDDAGPGIRRVRRGRGFSFHLPDGTLLEGEERERCLQLAVPPAWSDVWICGEAEGHLQATGRDDAGRKQYRYHDTWRALREAAKFAGLARFGTVLPALRARVDRDLRRHRLDRERVLALVTALLDATLLRVGSEDHADEDGGHGLTTLRPEHVEVGTTVTRFEFLGKSGVEQQVTLRDRRLTRQVGRMLEVGLPQVFGWRREDGTWRDVRRDEVNQHLRDVTGQDVSAKDFRTWGGTVRALATLANTSAADEPGERDRQRLAAVDAAADALGNTRAVARSSYVHPTVLDAHGSGAIAEAHDGDDGDRDRLGPHERALLRLLGAGAAADGSGLEPLASDGAAPRAAA